MFSRRQSHSRGRRYLYEIALKTVGNGSLATTIFKLNRGRLQPDGSRLQDPNVIEPGWILVLPATASGPGVRLLLLAAGLMAVGGWRRNARATRSLHSRHARVPLADVTVGGSSLLGIEIGNEPGSYYDGTSDYFSDFEANAAAIEAAAPGVSLVGPDPNHSSPSFIAAFASNEAAHPDVAEVTQHSYPTSTCGDSVATAGFFAPAFSGAAFCQFSHQNFTVDNGGLTVSYPAGSTAPSAGSPFGGAQACVPSSAGPGDTLALTYSVRFPSGFQFVKGGKLPGIYGGVEPFSGGEHNPNGWSMRLVWGAGGTGGIYAYTAKTTGFGDEYGQGNFSWQADGQWHTVTERVTVNTPGASDGSVTLSYDGRQVIRQTGVDITETNTPAAGLFFSTFNGGHDSSWAPTSDESISFKNFSASQQQQPVTTMSFFGVTATPDTVTR